MLRNGGYFCKMRNCGTTEPYCSILMFNISTNCLETSPFKKRINTTLSISCKTFAIFYRRILKKYLAMKKYLLTFAKNLALFYDLWLESVILVILSLIRVGGG